MAALSMITEAVCVLQAKIQPLCTALRYSQDPPWVPSYRVMRYERGETCQRRVAIVEFQPIRHVRLADQWNLREFRLQSK